MKRFTRYMLAELLRTFSLALAAMTGLSVFLFLVQEAIKQGLGPVAIMQLVPYALPNALYVAIPGTMLFSTCYVYGRMSASNEITAVNSLGIPVRRVITPVLIIATLLSFATLWLNDLAVSWGRRGAQTVVLNSVEQTMLSVLKANNSFNNQNISIIVADVDGTTLQHPSLILQDKATDETKTITAETATLHCFPERGVLTVTLNNGTASLGRDGEFHFDRIAPEISLSDMTRKENHAKSPSNYALAEIPLAIKNQEKHARKSQQRMAMSASYQMLSGDLTSLGSKTWQRKSREIQEGKIRRCRLQTEPWRRWANGFSCLLFVMVGTPLAIRLKNEDVWTCFGLCFLPILVIYFPLMLLGVDRAKAGALPPCAVWTGNLILLVIAIGLLRNVARQQ